MKYYSSQTYTETPHTSKLYSLHTELFSVDIDPLDKATYHAHAEVASLGSLTIGRINSTGAIVARKNEEITNPEFKRYSFVTVIEGEMIISHHLGVSELKSGQFTLMDNSFERSIFVPKTVQMMTVSVPGVVLERYLSNPESVEGLVLNSEQAPCSADTPLFSILLNSWEKVKAGSLRDFAPTLSDKLLRNIADIYSNHVHHQNSKKALRISQAKELIETHLSDPELSIEGLAEIMAVSSRYLRALFANSEKISHYILRRRLEDCAKLLADSRLQDMSITAIAFKSGFNSMAHFSRTFKKAYRVTPRDYRKLHTSS